MMDASPTLPYPDDFVSFLTGDDHPADMTQDDLFMERLDDHIPPSARICPMAVIMMIRRAHRNLGHPSIQSLVRLMETARCQASALEYAIC